MYLFDQRVMERTTSGTEVTEEPAQADSFRTPNCICSDFHPLPNENGSIREFGKMIAQGGHVTPSIESGRVR